jgi:Domain of unknown function (DUF4262)
MGACFGSLDVMPDDHFVCRCVLCHDCDDRGEADRVDLRICEDIGQHGWHVIMVPEDDLGPGFAYTIGLAHSYGAPELAMFGLDVRLMHRALNVLAQEAANGLALADGEEHAGVLELYPVILRRADQRWYRTFFGRAIGFYQRPPLPVLQVCWPDRKGAFHWQSDSIEQNRQSQPQLWVPPAEHPRGVWTAEV